MRKIDDMRVGDFLYLIDTLQEECKEEEYQSTYCCGCGQKLDWSKRTDG